MAKTRVKLKSAGIIALLNDPGVVGFMEDRMARVVAVYGTAHVETERHGVRTVVQVHSDKPSAFYSEANTGDLARAFGAAGGS